MCLQATLLKLLMTVCKCMAIIIKEVLDNNYNNTNCALPQAKNRGFSAYFSFALHRNILLKYFILIVFLHCGPGSDKGATSIIFVVLEKRSHFTHFTEMSSFGLI